MDAELSREICDEHLALVRMRLLKPPGLIEMLFERFVNALEMRQIAFIFRGSGELLAADRAEQLHRVVIDVFPQLPIEPAKQLDRIGMPHPPEVPGHLQQWLQRRRDFGKNLEGANGRRGRRISHGKRSPQSNEVHVARARSASVTPGYLRLFCPDDTGPTRRRPVWMILARDDDFLAERQTKKACERRRWATPVATLVFKKIRLPTVQSERLPAQHLQHDED